MAALKSGGIFYPRWAQRAENRDAYAYRLQLRQTTVDKQLDLSDKAAVGQQGEKDAKRKEVLPPHGKSGRNFGRCVSLVPAALTLLNSDLETDQPVFLGGIHTVTRSMPVDPV